MGNIIILDENTSNKIAAGEVIEKPASVIKELVENSIDAGARSISVEIKNGGISFIKVTDNGAGIEEDDVEIAFERHGTSKIRNADDLESISSLGFRGEALASIAAVSTVELTTRTNNSPHGTYVRIQAGIVKEVRQTGCPVGTTFIIKDLFYNTPARFKFLKKDATEAGYISDIISRIAVGNPQISFKLNSSNSTVIHTPGNNDLLSTIFSIYGKETAKEVAEVNYSNDLIQISGFTGKPEIARSNRNYQSIYINGRYVKSKLIASAIDEAYKTFLMKNKYAFIVLNLKLNPVTVDVNVHPTKMEVRFSDEQEIFRSVYHAVTNALLSKPLLKTVSVEKKENDAFKFKEESYMKKDYRQDNFLIKTGNVKEETKIKDFNNYFNIKNNMPGTEDNITKDVIKKPDIIYKPISKEQDKAPDLNIDPNNRSEKKEDTEDIKEDIDIWKSILINSRIIGQAFSTYIILQHESELILIDQHAAHERVKYEYIKTKYFNNESFSQMLISPIVIDLTNQEAKFLENEVDYFEKLGFIYESFGNNSIIVRSVPDIFDVVSVKESFLQVLDFVMNSNITDYKRVTDDTLYTIACKAAVKANKKLDELEIKNLINQLSIIEKPFTCPHGRPTVIKITKHELEKMFKRIL